MNIVTVLHSFFFVFLIFIRPRESESRTLNPSFVYKNYGQYCEFPDYEDPLYSIQAYGATLMGVQPVVYDAATSSLSTYFPPYRPVPFRYHIQGTRGRDESTCSFCLYDMDADAPRIQYTVMGGQPYDSSPLFGPCLDRAFSVKTSCVQNTFLFPPTFVGEYYYPDQYAIPSTAERPNEEGSFFFEHQFLYNDDIQYKEPTDFGLGKGRVQSMIASVAIKNRLDNSINTTLTSLFMHDYTTEDGWLLWAQHYCTPACHRNAEYQLLRVQESDWLDKSPLLQYLSRKITGSDTLTMVRCHVCPPSHMAYLWSKTYDRPLYENLAWNVFSPTCFPWFGALPLFDAVCDFQVQSTVSNTAPSSVYYPSTSTYYASMACPVNTYNDVCAHTIRYYEKVARQIILNVPGLTKEQAQAKAACKPCPPGYHTNGQTGAWFCLPPAGHLFTNRLALLAFQDSQSNPTHKNQSLAWTRRDNIGYEFECGFLPEHCKQCHLYSSTAGMLPDAFNQKMILETILTAIPCPSGYYCPHPLLQDKQRCPLANKPYSPPGSSSAENCTCAAGTFLNAAGHCEACHEPSVCPVGMYLSGYSMCMTKDGMTTTGHCVDCTNAPSGLNYTSTGFEYFSHMAADGRTAVFYGSCPFACPYAHQLTVVSSPPDGDFCKTTWKCISVPALQRNGQRVYAPALADMRDRFTMSLSSGCGFYRALTDALEQDTLSVIPVYSSCQDYPSMCTREHPCRVLEPATLSTQVVCTACSALPLDASFTEEAKNQITLNTSSNCAFQCNQPQHYVNQTAHSCQSCQALTNAVCLNNISWQVRGGGCLTNTTAFPSTVLQMHASDWCVSCVTQPPAYGSNTYLDLELCKIQNCPVNPPPNYYFIPPGCGGTSVGQLGACVTSSSCAPHQFLQGSACSRNSTPVCANCTEFKLGFYKTLNCTFPDTDAEWQPCPVGYTCNGGAGAPIPCPYPKTSRLGPDSLCVCPAGMQRNVLDASICEYMQCSDKTQTNVDASKYGLLPPGDNYFSRYYMQLDTTSQNSECFPCPTNGFTLDEHAVGPGSCRCPFHHYMLPQKGGGCAPCPLTGCPGCWRGDVVCGTIASMAPFMDSSDMCSAGFSMSPERSSWTGTGSAAYVERDNVLTQGGWKVRYEAPMGTITHMATTSPSANDDGLPQALHLSFYMLSNYPLSVFVKPLPTPDMPPTLFTYTPWCLSAYPLDYTEKNFKTAQLAASSWPRQTTAPSSPGLFNSAHSAWVGLVFYNLFAGSLTLAVNRVAYTYTSAIEWSSGSECGQRPGMSMIPLYASDFWSNQTEIAALQHQFVYPAVANDLSSTFYVAINTLSSTLVKACSATDAMRISTRDLTQSDGRRITAMAVLGSASGAMLYIAFDTSPQSVRLVPWTSTNVEESEEIFFPATTSAIVFLSFAWSTEPLLWARAHEYVVTADTSVSKTSSSSSRLRTQRLYVADKDYQRTFTAVQNMPAASHPSLGPHVVSTNLNTGWLMAAHGNKMYYLPMHRCLPSTSAVDGVTRARYWPDSDTTVGCVSHTCVRPRSCTMAQQYWNKDLQRCMCQDGYYKDTTVTTMLKCLPCPEGFYCFQNEKQSCGSVFTSEALARSVNDCVCPLGQAYVQSLCRPCATGYWCPNRWEAHPCPGHSDSSDASMIYPFACVCEAGYTGPGCGACPADKVCQRSIKSLVVTNYVLSFHLLFTTSSNASDTVCQTTSSRLTAFLAPVDAGVQIYCTFLPANPPHTDPMVVTMVQTSTTAGAAQAQRMSTAMSLNFTNFVVSRIHFTSNQLQSNPPVLCSTDNSKIPTSDAKACQCAAGWRTSATSGVCIACEPNYYKPTPGPCSLLQCANGGCLPCPSGMTSSSGASACSSSSSSNVFLNDTSDSSSSSTPANLAAIIGGVVGGVVFVVILLFVVNQFYATSSV